MTNRIYQYTRNPMYLALTGALVTNAAWLGSVRTVLPVPAFTAAVTAFQVLPEERALAERFGRDYEEYRQRVPAGWAGGGRAQPSSSSRAACSSAVCRALADRNCLPAASAMVPPAW